MIYLHAIQYFKYRKFKNVFNLGANDASGFTGWFIENNELFDNLYLLDNYDFRDDNNNILHDEINEAIDNITQKIKNKHNTTLIIDDGRTFDYTTIEADFVLLTCDTALAQEKAIADNPSAIFCLNSFMNNYKKTKLAFDWIENGLIFPYLYIRSANLLFFTANPEQHKKEYDFVCKYNFQAFMKHRTYNGIDVCSVEETKPYNQKQLINEYNGLWFKNDGGNDL